jgi:hypothetical protein
VHGNLEVLEMIDERRLNRVQVMSYLKICYRDNGNELGRVVDISAEGMRLCGVEPIQTDRTLTFRLALPPTPKGKSEIDFDADIIWCRRAKNPQLYDTGIKLRDLSPEKIELIEDYLQKSSQEDRWLSVIKSIKGEY